MTNILLYASQQSQILDVVIWALLIAIMGVSVFLIFWQRRIGRELAYELSFLDKVKKNNIEYEFVLKAMRLSTWHIDPQSMAVTYDNDFRDKGNEWVPISDGTKLEDSNQQLHEQDIPRVAKSLNDICQGRIEEYHEEYRVKIPHSNRVYWEESYATIAERDVDGKPKSIVGTSMRIDDRKAMEKALVDARNRAEESDRLKTAFLANMSHEIRTPLNAIVGFTSVLPDVQDPTERQGLLDLIHENTQKLLRIVDDVVNISKVEAGKEELVLSQFDLSITLSQVADEFRPKLKPGVSLDTQFAASPQMITSDYNRLREVMKHLVSNAVKFTDQGSVTVGFDMPQDGRIKMWVRDTGKGVAKEHQERIFERFFKVDEFIPGAGLGLSICRTMAYSMGGSVVCESQLGEGSVFTFDIPIQ